MTWPQAILFDLDGTLVDSVADLASALNRVLGDDGFPELSVEAVTGMVGGGVPMLIERALKVHGETPAQDRIANLYPRFLEMYGPHAADETRLFPDVREALEAFHDKGIRLGVCTNKPEKISRMILDSLSVAHLFGAVIGGDTLPVKKPDPEPLIEGFKRLGCAPESGLMVGDSGADANAARAAGVAVILVTYGYTRVPVEELPNDGIVDSFALLPDAIGHVLSCRAEA